MAVEEYLAQLEGEPFRVERLIDAAGALESVGFGSTKRVRESAFALSFEDALRQLRVP